MINTQDQDQLFKLISNYLDKDITCYALGGTAMMYYGFKNITKDIDLVFDTASDRGALIRAVLRLGYKEQSIKGIFPERGISKPVMLSRGEERFDLFLKDIFGFIISQDFKANFFARHDYIGKKEFIIKVLPKEAIILLKAATGREKDFEDIRAIIEQDKDIDWDRIVDEAIHQCKVNPWILLDVEEIMQKLKTVAFIPSRLFERIYKAK